MFDKKKFEEPKFLPAYGKVLNILIKNGVNDRIWSNVATPILASFGKCMKKLLS